MGDAEVDGVMMREDSGGDGGGVGRGGHATWAMTRGGGFGGENGGGKLKREEGNLDVRFGRCRKLGGAYQEDNVVRGGRV